jgi:hypothetical protein
MADLIGKYTLSEVFDNAFKKSKETNTNHWLGLPAWYVRFFYKYFSWMIKEERVKSDLEEIADVLCQTNDLMQILPWREV